MHDRNTELYTTATRNYTQVQHEIKQDRNTDFISRFFVPASPGGDAIPMIAVSANAFDEDRQKSAEAGMNAHIAKPIDIGELLRVMREFI